MQRLAHNIVKMRAQSVHGDGLAFQIPDGLDRAVLQHVKDRLHLIVDPVAGIGRDEIVARRNGIQHRRRGRRTDRDAAASQRHQRRRPALGIAHVFKRNAGTVEIAQFGGKLMALSPPWLAR